MYQNDFNYQYNFTQNKPLTAAVSVCGWLRIWWQKGFISVYNSYKEVRKYLSKWK